VSIELCLAAKTSAYFHDSASGFYIRVLRGYILLSLWWKLWHKLVHHFSICGTTVILS